MMFRFLVIATLAACAETLQFAARPTVSRTSCIAMTGMSRRGALIAAAVLASGGSPAYASDLATTVEMIDTKAVDRNANGPAHHHTPSLTVNPKRISVLSRVEYTVPCHEMNGHKPHFIQYMWLKDAVTHDVLAVKEFSPSDNTRPSMAASISKGRRVVPLLYCNVHGLWEGDEFVCV